MLEWLETTSVAIWVGESAWGYPAMLGAHAIGLAVAVGVSIVVDLRALGAVRELPLAALPGLLKLVWAGLFVNAASGLALFASQATTFAQSLPFGIKLAAIGVAVAAGVRLQRGLAGPWLTSSVPGAGRLLAGLSLGAWLCAVCAGRLMAYL